MTNSSELYHVNTTGDTYLSGWWIEWLPPLNNQWVHDYTLYTKPPPSLSQTPVLQAFAWRTWWFWGVGCFVVGLIIGVVQSPRWLHQSSEASTYGSGSINATFASDILRLQDLWTGIMWSLLSPLSRVLITIVYAFTVSPQVRSFRRQISSHVDWCPMNQPKNQLSDVGATCRWGFWPFQSSRSSLWRYHRALLLFLQPPIHWQQPKQLILGNSMLLRVDMSKSRRNGKLFCSG